MEHLAQDLTNALEESESCGALCVGSNKKWYMRRRTRSAGNIRTYLNKSGDNHSDDSSSTNSENVKNIAVKGKIKRLSFHHSDSDEFSLISRCIRAKVPMCSFVRTKKRTGWAGGWDLLDTPSDSFNEQSPARPILRRKRKLKRMNVDETPVTSCGKRKRSQRLDISDKGKYKHPARIKPLHKSIVAKIEKFCKKTCDSYLMDTQSQDNENYEIGSDSSSSWSGEEGHEGDDELTDWAPTGDPVLGEQASGIDYDPREIRAGCRRLGDERPGFSICTGANERVVKFLQDPKKVELKLYSNDKEKIAQLAALYSLELWSDEPNCTILRKTYRTPCMQPTQRHHGGLCFAHKRIRTRSGDVTSF